MQIHYEFNQRDLGHGASESVLHPVVAVALLVTLILLLWRPRKYGLPALILCTFLVPRGQELLIAGAHFYVRQILVLAGFTRVMAGRFRLAGGWQLMDSLFVVWIGYRVFAGTVTNWPSDTMEQMGFLMTGICGYFLFRCLLKTEGDLMSATKSLAICAAVVGVFMVYERVFLVNLFGLYLGGVEVTPLIRNGSGRAQGTFGVSILAGCFGATLIPLFAWYWKKNKKMAVVGLAGATLMTLTTVSSTPIMAYFFGVVGMCMWPIRRSMRWVRWGIVTAIVVTAIVMKAPVWFAIAHLDVIGGSGGYDRAMLVDTCIRHFSDWWLIGTNQNGGWGYDMWDLSNQFVAEAELGGIVTLICFVGMIVTSYRRLGAMRKRVKPDRQWLLWCLGCIMTAHIFAYFGVAYWDQTQIWWFAFLATICAVTSTSKGAVLRKSAAAGAPATAALPQPEKAVPVGTAARIFSEWRKPMRPWGGPEL